MTSLARTLVRPERLYLAALALTGVAAVWSVALPATQRGQLTACVVSATLGAGVGSFSIDTFLLSRPSGWVFDRGRWWVVCLVVGSVALSAGAAAAITALAGLGSFLIAVLGAGALTVCNACASLSLRLERFGFVYLTRAAGAAALVGGYAYLYLHGDRDGLRWAGVWLAAQALAALVVGAGLVRRARHFDAAEAARPARPGRPARPARAYLADLAALAKLHVGIGAQLLTYRLDQVLLARYAGAGPLGVYALAASALEFAQAGAVVKAQRILARREATTGPEPVTPVVKATLAVAALAVVGLAGLGVLAPQYADAWLLGLLLLPGCIGVAVAKTWGANLLKQRGEAATTYVALGTLAVAVPGYLALVPLVGTVGAAITSSFVYVLQALGSRLRLRPQPTSPLASRAV